MDTPAEANKFSQPFKEMAARIERILPSEFAGAVLILPPTGEPIAVMIADPKKDLEAFWAVTASKVTIATQEFQSAKQGGQGFGHRR